MQSMSYLKYMHPAYQTIIGMGEKALPHIFMDMKQHPRHWAWALQHITQENPVRAGANAKEVAEAWIQWGKRHGYA